ncbi:MAG: DUF3604 domain-containing protein [Myxococcota bacterium]
MPHRLRLVLALLLVPVALACSSDEEVWSSEEGDSDVPSIRFPTQDIFEPDYVLVERETAGPNPDRNAYFGDLHVHTTYSFDAFAFGTVATPADAYRYARGEVIRHPGGFDVQLRQPLDFYAVTDHAMFMGAARSAADTTSELSKFDFSEGLHDLNAPDNINLTSVPQRIAAFSGLLPKMVAAVADGRLDRELVNGLVRSAWADTVEAADRFYVPGRFTTFAAYEYTSSTDDMGNLHRNVIFRGTEKLPAIPFSRFHSQNPEGLWDWMDALRALGVESLAIPHNSNGSNGQMFKLVDWAGNPLDDAYGEQRMRNEPLVEITQVKGTSETHPTLSDTDEWAGFEIAPFRVATMLPSAPPGSYVRDALRRGLQLEAGGATNPYEFGLVGASDTHTAAISDDESDYFAKIGLLDSTAELRGSVPLSFVESTVTKMVANDLVTEVDGQPYQNSASITYGASGLAAVWSEENTRESIYDAFRRKETFATSGPRIPVRFFAGDGIAPGMDRAADMAALGYAGGVPMGADLEIGPSSAPRFLVWAAQDPLSAPLQRLQIIKGWEQDGRTFEVVNDVACSDGLAPDPETRRCPDNGAKVDLDDCSITTDVGDAELSAVWTDPDFDPAQRAFYYVRVLENPTCRWSTWDAVRAGAEPRSDFPKTIQERAWSSPIQVKPAG